ncbi:FecR family protein [Bacteroides cellulosilyticus]|uniref:FecR family protein n=1 Tax=Bacteroides cellulosilyticus TaxID=246787 RepID=UPI0035695F10
MNKNTDAKDLELQISNYLSGNCTEEEKETLLAFLANNDDAANTFKEMSAVWAVSSIPAFAEMEDENLSLIKERISLSESPATILNQSRKHISVWLKVAAAVILLLGCNYFWYIYTENLTEVYTSAESPYEIKVPAGSRTNIVLPDGTEVALNAGSVLRYSRGFGIRERNVTLNGEGFFKVAKDEKIPFYVENNDVRVQVVGTVFNVRGYDDDNYVLVSLLEGRVNLTAVSGSVMMLYPDEQALYNKSTGRMEKMKSNAGSACDWLDGGLTFENVSFADIAHRLERKFQVKIKIESERLKLEHFSGCFNSNQNISDILKEINVENQYTWRVNGDTIFITDKKGGKIER